MNNDNNVPKQAYTWLTGLLTGWGLRQSWAKIAAGAVIGAAVAAGLLSLPSCTADQRAQVETAHAVYHAATGKPCIIKKEEGGK